jgi:hypothetical protein
MDGIDDDVMEELCVGNDYNHQSKGASTYNNSSSTSKLAVKKNYTMQASTSKETSTEKYYGKTKSNEKDPNTNKSTTSMDLTHKILGDLKIDYDVVEDLKKMKSNITVFKMGKITQLREKLHKTLQHIQGPKDVSVGYTKVTPKVRNVKENKVTKTSSVANTLVDDKANTTDEINKGEPRMDGPLIGNKYSS